VQLFSRGLNKAAAGIISAFLFFLIASCDSMQEEKSAIIPENETIAVVNNKKISLSKFQRRLQRFLLNYRPLLSANEEQLNTIKETVVHQLIKEELMFQEASRRGIRISQEELETTELESITPFQGEQFDRYLRDNNFSHEQWRDHLKRILLEKKLIKKEINDKIPVTKREIQQYYEKNKDEFQQPKAYRVRSITLASRNEAEAILHQVKTKNEFIKMIRDYSISLDKIADGDLGFIEEQELPEEMENAIFRLTRSKRFSPVIHSQDGYHIFYLEKIRRPGLLPLNAVKSKIKETLAELRRDKAYEVWMNYLKKTASIEIDDAVLASEEGF